jgi:putative ABC transport system permease protein
MIHEHRTTNQTVSIARKNLLEDIPRFLVAQAGIMFAVSLVTIQTGILQGFTRSTVQLIEGSKADFWVASEKMVHFELTEPLSYSQVNEVKQIPGVETAEPLMMSGARWRPPQGDSSPAQIIGFDLAGKLFQPGQIIQGSKEKLKQPLTVMADEIRLRSLEVPGVNTTAQLSSLPARLVALTQDTQSIVSSTFLFASLENANTYINSSFSSEIECKLGKNGQVDCTTVYHKLPQSATVDKMIKPMSLTTPINYILVKAKPGQNLQQLQKTIETALPGTRAYTQTAMAEKTGNYWQQRTGIGLALDLGAVVGVVVGMVVVTQILYASVSEHIKEFGTLKAMGASNRVVYSIVMEQSLWMAFLGYVPGMALCWSVSLWAATKGIIILITPVSAIGVLGIVIVMCLTSGFFAVQKVINVDPAIVFKA